MAEHMPKMNKKMSRNQDQKKSSPSPKDQPSKKQNRKAENPVRVPPPTDLCSDLRCENSWICKNSACRATRSIDDTFCKRCSCCICHLYDDNKDPSLWLECLSESGQEDSCGMSCHIECALQHKKVGVVDLGQLMQLDGSYCCFSCGKVSGILGYWKKQLIIAKDARRVDSLCYRIFLSYRLLEGTTKFKELHNVVEDAKAMLETEVGPLSGVSAKMARGIVSRLSIAGDVQSLCSNAIEKADEWLASKSNTSQNVQEGSLPAACKFIFEEVGSSSVVIVLIDISNISSEDIKGYKLWYCRTRDDVYTEEPVSVFPRNQRRILISSLQPCSEYSFRIISYTDAGDFGHSEAKCFTKSIEIIHKNVNSVVSRKKENTETGGCSTGAIETDSGFKVRDLRKILRLVWAREHGCLDGICGVEEHNCCETSENVKHETMEEDQQPTVSRQLDLNIASVPDLNEELIPPVEFSLNEENGCTMGPTVEADDDAVSREIELNGAIRSHGSGDSHTWNNGQNGEGPTVDSNEQVCRKRAASRNGDTHDSDSTLINGSPLRFRNGSGSLDENFEYCVKIIRWLECEGHITRDFRLKLLTWFSLRSTEQERRVVNTFIQTLVDDPSSLGGQLVDSFSDIISTKKPRNGFCSKLWH
ncbi:hypothetical protein Leryth_026553 [Lithospermum erythrorhizon]|nr:hypothetical protein Leryth_026553 [Lithospermum erythrorhizon]